MMNLFKGFWQKIKVEKLVDKTCGMLDDYTYMDRTRTESKYFTRDRKMPFKKLMRFMLTPRSASTQNELERYFDKLGEPTFMTQQAFSEARHKIKHTAFVELFEMTAQESYSDEYECETWNEYRTSAVDGSKIDLPAEERLRKHFGTVGAGGTSAAAQGSILYDVLNDVIMDAAIEPIATDERTLAERHIDTLYKNLKPEKELIIFDRGYACFSLIQKLEEKGFKFLMRVRTKFNIDIDNQKDADGIVYLKQKDKKIKVRVIKFPLLTGETETLITNIWDENISVDSFGELYFKRWPIETKYDVVKNKLEIENFSGLTVEAIKQDFFATMYLINIASAAKAAAQVEADEQRKGKDNLYEYKINVNHEVGVLKDRFIFALSNDICAGRAKEIRKILDLLMKKMIPVRKGRSNRRKIPRNTKFHHNQKSNC